MTRTEMLKSFVDHVAGQDACALPVDEEILDELIEEWLEAHPEVGTVTGRMRTSKPNQANKPKPRWGGGKAAAPRKKKASDSPWKAFIEACTEALDDIEDLPDKLNDRGSWYEKVDSMRTWSEEHEHVTETMTESLDRILEGVSKWSR